jgi:hypothetical protein
VHQFRGSQPVSSARPRRNAKENDSTDRREPAAWHRPSQAARMLSTMTEDPVMHRSVKFSTGISTAKSGLRVC